MQRFQKVSKKVLVASGAAILSAANASAAAITMPVVDYTDIQSAATIGFGVTLTVGLLMAAKRFFR
jgi:opacity protein-like surface antigen